MRTIKNGKTDYVIGKFNYLAALFFGGFLAPSTAGASRSGKTASMPYLKEFFGKIAVYDFDDIGVPDDANKT